jgi:hypothetical protein
MPILVDVHGQPQAVEMFAGSQHFPKASVARTGIGAGRTRNTQVVLTGSVRGANRFIARPEWSFVKRCGVPLAALFFRWGLGRTVHPATAA